METVEFRGWKGMKNGDLLAAASSVFDVFVTMDDSLPEQRNLGSYDLAVVVLRARSKSLDHLRELIPETERILPFLRSGDVRRIHPPETQIPPAGGGVTR